MDGLKDKKNQLGATNLIKISWFGDGFDWDTMIILR